MIYKTDIALTIDTTQSNMEVEAKWRLVDANDFSKGIEILRLVNLSGDSPVEINMLISILSPILLPKIVTQAVSALANAHPIKFTG